LSIVFYLERTNQLSLLPDKDLVDLCHLIQPYQVTKNRKTEEKQWLTEVSSIPLQQSLRDLETAYSNFFASCKGKRKGKKVKPPKFKKRKSKQSVRFTDNGFTVNQHHVTLAKIGDLKVVWSRPLSVISYQLSVISYQV